MTAQDALIELLERLGAARDGKVYVTAAELSEWPSEAVTALKAQKLLGRARPAQSVVCPGCERACAMPVHTLTRANGTASSFVVCDKRDDISRVPVSAERLTQWRCDAEAVCGFIAKSLELNRSEKRSSIPAVWNIGVVRGNKRAQMLCLRADGELAVIVGSNAMPLAEVVGFHDGRLSVDVEMIQRLVGSATTADPRYTPTNARRETRKLDTQEMYESWRKAYRVLKKQRPNRSDVWYAQQIAKLPVAAGRDAETIRKHMKK